MKDPLFEPLVACGLDDSDDFPICTQAGYDAYFDAPNCGADQIGIVFSGDSEADWQRGVKYARLIAAAPALYAACEAGCQQLEACFFTAMDFMPPAQQALVHAALDAMTAALAAARADGGGQGNG